MTEIILILFCHFIGDFLLQSDNMACNKSKSLYWLLLHGVAYSAGLLLAFQSIEWVIWNGVAHIAVDYFTSRANAILYQKSRHWFFVMIGFDQFIHVGLLLLTIRIF